MNDTIAGIALMVLMFFALIVLLFKKRDPRRVEFRNALYGLEDEPKQPAIPQKQLIDNFTSGFHKSELISVDSEGNREFKCPTCGRHIIIGPGGITYIYGGDANAKHRYDPPEFTLNIGDIRSDGIPLDDRTLQPYADWMKKYEHSKLD